MKYLKRVFLLMLTLVLLSSVAFADATPSLSIQRLLLHEDGTMSMVVHTTAAGELPASRFSLLIDGKSVDVDEVQSYKSTDLGTSWLILSDISTIGSTKNVTTIASGIVDLLDSDDNAGILVNGSTTEQIALSDRPLELKSIIDGDLLNRNYNIKTMNETAATAIRFLQQYNGVKNRACLVIMSSGENKNESGMTTDELRELIKASDVTVYTVTFKDDNPHTTQISVFESLARASSGGAAISIRHGASSSNLTAALEEIRANEAQYRLITFKPSDIIKEGGEFSLSLTDGDYTLSDTIALTAGQMVEYQGILAALSTPVPSKPTQAPSNDPIVPKTPKPTEEPTPEPTEEATPEPTEEPTPEPTEAPTPTPEPSIGDKLKDNLPLVAICAAAIIAVIVIIAVVASKKKNKSDDDPQPPVDPVAPVDPADLPMPPADPVIPPVNPITPPGVQPVQQPKLHIVLSCHRTRMNYEGNMQGNVMIIGRDPSSASVLVGHPDTTISGMHLRLTYHNDGTLTAKDISRNGTKVNGTPIKTETVLHKNDLLTLGEARFNINWNEF